MICAQQKQMQGKRFPSSYSRQKQSLHFICKMHASVKRRRKILSHLKWQISSSLVHVNNLLTRLCTNIVCFKLHVPSVIFMWRSSPFSWKQSFLLVLSHYIPQLRSSIDVWNINWIYGMQLHKPDRTRQPQWRCFCLMKLVVFSCT